MNTITATELAAWLADKTRDKPVLLDVREPWEYQACHIEGSWSMPMNIVPDKLAELSAEQPIVCICHHGMRSMQIGAFLEQNGFTQVNNLSGGVHAWAQQVDGSMPIY